ncbi:MAG: hypothetical protein P0S96_04625 [Simkaniaceae bacterium]|nr:hypothetical protein [Candidatus Sacchlamyda saccharinae]
MALPVRTTANGVAFQSAQPFSQIVASITTRNDAGVQVERSVSIAAGQSIVLDGNPNQYLEVVALRYFDGRSQVVGSVAIPFSEMTPGRVVLLQPPQ